MSAPLTALAHGLLLGAGGRQDVLDGIRSGLTAKPDSRELIIGLIAAVALLFLLLLLRRVFGREGRRTAPAAPVDALAEAMRILALSRAEQDDLRRLASHCCMAEPAAMLLSPANLARAYERGFAKIGDADLRRRLDLICQRTFDAPLPLPDEDDDARR